MLIKFHAKIQIIINNMAFNLKNIKYFFKFITLFNLKHNSFNEKILKPNAKHI